MNEPNEFPNPEDSFTTSPAEGLPENFGDDEEEFSLDQLSQAYAKMLHRNLGVEETTEAEEFENEPEEGGTDEIDELDDQNDNAGISLSESAIIEAVLFVGVTSGQKLTAKKLASVLRDVSPKEIKKIVQELNRRYEQEQTPYHIELADNGYQMSLRESFSSIRDRFYGEVREAQLNQMAIDTLSIVAYQQPISRADIDQIRQRPSGSILSQLVERQLLQTTPESTGKNKIYQTSDRFLELFGLSSLEDLPQTADVDDIGEFFDDSPSA
ncbi:MAG: SMC-Scp complex subunit ScpB [Pirellulaceae bacterium]|nr:SMC-Scp complex subunit ScpB [Pirellulaceae bacterium]